jgi:hypothetical protein
MGDGGATQRFGMGWPVCVIEIDLWISEDQLGCVGAAIVRWMYGFQRLAGKSRSSFSPKLISPPCQLLWPSLKEHGFSR